jgi:hypothetical protein
MARVTHAKPGGEHPNNGSREALDEFVRAVRTSIATEAPDPAVAIAFAAGWHAADAMSAAPAAEAGDAAGSDTLTLAGAMLRADIARLAERLAAAAQDEEVAALKRAIGRFETPGAREDAAAETDRRFGASLMAADFRLGKAFVLGCRIAELRESDPFDAGAFAQRFIGEHDGLEDALSQLATALPPNAGHSVRDSLNMWANALTEAGGMTTPRPSNELAALQSAHVSRQVEAWRTLLSGEKAGRDMLELPDYVGVAQGVADELGEVVRNGLKRFWGLVTTAVLLLLVGIGLIIILRDSAGFTAGLATVFASFGLTWKGLGASLGRAVAKVEQPAWSAQVDRAIAFAITGPLPDELVVRGAEGTLLWQLGKWRKEHERPVDQGGVTHAGGRVSPVESPAQPAPTP